MYLIGLGTALPSGHLTQADAWDIFRRAPEAGSLRAPSRELVRRVLQGESGIETRHFAVDPTSLFGASVDDLHRSFRAAAPALAVQALQEALTQARINPSELDALVVCTCTGYLCPGISSFVAEAIGLRPDALGLDLVGLGCGAALPAIETAAGIVAQRPESKVAVVAVEVCSAAFYVDDDPGVLISLCLFGDGAAATIWTGEPAAYPEAQDKYQWSGFQTVHRPEQREALRFEHVGGKLRNLLRPEVPTVVAETFATRIAPASFDGIDRVISHGGGKKVLDALETKLPEHLAPASARATLARCGNMSSPSVLFALEDEITRGTIGTSNLLLSFGAGFTMHAAQLERQSGRSS